MTDDKVALIEALQKADEGDGLTLSQLDLAGASHALSIALQHDATSKKP